MKDEQRLPKQIRNDSPCKGCTERFTACSDRCPKHLRGEYGYDEWKDEIHKTNQIRKQYIDDKYEERKRERWVFGK